MEENRINIDQDMEKKYLSMASSVSVRSIDHLVLHYQISGIQSKYPSSSTYNSNPLERFIEWIVCDIELTNTLYLNYTTIKQLELLFDTKAQSSKNSLFFILNHTHTVVGKRLLRSFLLTPSADPVVQPIPIHL